jgi:hypothetical protein
MWIFKPAWESEDEKRRMEAVRKMTDVEKLKELALTASDKNVRIAAVEKITDREVLKEFALTVSDKYVRWVAVGKITDQEILKEVALKDSNWVIRKTAVEKITDEAVLIEVALKDKYWRVRDEAVYKITDENMNKTLRQLVFDSIGFDEIKEESKDFIKLSIDQIRTLMDIAERNPKIMKTEWRILEERVKYVHKDYDDKCNFHEDRHTNSGQTFPPYPFKD